MMRTERYSLYNHLLLYDIILLNLVQPGNILGIELFEQKKLVDGHKQHRDV